MRTALVVADTTPLNYLILIGLADVLGQLFEHVMVPVEVALELSHPGAPALVSTWIKQPPPWLSIRAVGQLDLSIGLGSGETAAISLAVESGIPAVLMDERKGRAAAQQRQLLTVGTLNILDLADEAGLVDGLAALAKLRATSFRANAQLLRQLELTMLARRSP